jgi:hypothetical protein
MKGATGAKGVTGATGNISTTDLNDIAWLTSGNTAGTNFIGTRDNASFQINTNNVPRVRFTTASQIETLNTNRSVFVGEGAGAASSAKENTFIGYQAGNSTGSNNSALGHQALSMNLTGSNNTANGDKALASNTTGSFNTGLGSGADVVAGDLTNAMALGNGAIVDASNKVQIGNASITRAVFGAGVTGSTVVEAGGYLAGNLTVTNSAILGATGPSLIVNGSSG